MSKKVLCSDCGFLCWKIQHESGEGPVSIGTVSTLFRNKFQKEEAGGRSISYDSDTQSYADLGCLRGLWQWTTSVEKNFEAVDDEQLRKPRTCVYSLKFEPGSTPEEHKQLFNEKRLRNVTWSASLLGAGVGAAGAILAQILYVLVTQK